MPDVIAGIAVHYAAPSLGTRDIVGSYVAQVDTTNVPAHGFLLNNQESSVLWTFLAISTRSRNESFQGRRRRRPIDRY